MNTYKGWDDVAITLLAETRFRFFFGPLARVTQYPDAWKIAVAEARRDIEEARG